MNRRQRIADSDMRYLASAWRSGYDGPRLHADGSAVWRQIKQQTMRVLLHFDESRVEELHRRWLRVAEDDRYSAAVLVFYYREKYAPGECTFSEAAVLAALDRFSRA